MNHSIHCVGIDLGHKNAIVAVNTNGIIKVCADSSSTKIFPTLISYGEERRFFGDQAQLNQPDNISFTIANLRKLIGLQYNSPDRERIDPDFGFSLCKLENELTGIWCRNFPKPNAFSPEQCIASFLKYLIKIAKENDPEVNKLYLSVDPDCSNIQRIGLLNAAKIAGIDCELVTSTVAAGAAYIHSHTDKIEQTPHQSKTICVVDIGESSLKASILKLSQNTIEVIAHQQKNEISGNKITELLTEYLLNKISQKYFINLKNDLRNKSWSMYQFLKSVENAKKILSVNTSVQFEYQYGDIYIRIPINREDFEDIIEEYAEYCASFVNELIETSDDFPTFIELIGGTSRIPLFRKKIKEIEEIGIKVVSNINVDECVAIGCAMKPSLQIRDKLYRPIKIESENKIVFDALEFIPTISKSFNKIVNFSCRVKVESNGSYYKVYVDSNGVFRVNYDINYVKVTIPNDFSENQIKEFRKIEKSLKKRDKNVKESDNLKIMLESKIYEAEGIFRDMINELIKNKKLNKEQLSKEKELKKKELLKIIEFQELDQIANEIRKWFDRNEGIRRLKDEYKSRIEKLSSPISETKKILDQISEITQDLETCRSEIFNLKQKISRDRPREDDGLKEEILKLCDDSILPLEFVQNMYQYPNMLNKVVEAWKEVKDNINTISDKRKELLKKPLLVIGRRNRGNCYWE